MAEQDQLEAGSGGESVEEAKEKKKGGMSLIIMLVPLLLLGLAGGGWVAYSQYTSLAVLMHSDEEEAEEEGDEPIEYGEFMELDPIIANPAGSGGQRYLMIKVGLEAAEAKVLEELGTKSIVVKETILGKLSAQTVEDLADIGKRDQIKEEVRGALNSILSEGEISRLYFTEYVLQ